MTDPTERDDGFVVPPGGSRGKARTVRPIPASELITLERKYVKGARTAMNASYARYSNAAALFNLLADYLQDMRGLEAGRAQALAEVAGDFYDGLLETEAEEITNLASHIDRVLQKEEDAA